VTNNLVMNKTVTLAEATAHISSLVTEAAAGTEITITRHGKPVARIVGAPRKVKRMPGDWGWVGPFDPSVLAPMTDEEMREEGWPV
jgi:prevent-host-death family protein